MTHPLPSYAVACWIAGDNLMVAFPGTLSEKGHTIKLPASAAGLDTAIKIMKARAEADDLRIGNRGTPTQYEVEAGKAWGTVSKRMAKEHREAVEAKVAEKAEISKRQARKKEREAAEAAEFLKGLGL